MSNRLFDRSVALVLRPPLCTSFRLRLERKKMTEREDRRKADRRNLSEDKSLVQVDHLQESQGHKYGEAQSSDASHWSWGIVFRLSKTFIRLRSSMFCYGR